MFDDIKKPTRPEIKTRQDNKLLVILGCIAGLLMIIAAVLAYKVATTPDYTIPNHITENAQHPIYIPKKLPGGYKIIDGSFAISEEALLFRVEDSSGSSLAFTEQKRPQNFDFEQFYRDQMQSAKKLSGTPHPSVLGKSPSGDRFLLSIVTDDTWILVSTAAPLNEQDFTLIAKGIKKN